METKPSFSKKNLLLYFSETPLSSDLLLIYSSLPQIISTNSIPPESEKPIVFNSNEAILTYTKTPKKNQGKSPKNNVFFPAGDLPLVYDIENLHYKTKDILKAPFSNCSISNTLTDRNWFYLDEQNNVQGPFTSIEMDNWFEKGYFFDELQITHSEINQFYPLSMIFQKIQNSKLFFYNLDINNEKNNTRKELNQVVS